MGKIKSLKFNGCPIYSHFFCSKDFKTVFVFVLAQLEGPPQKNFGFNGNFNWKMTKKVNGQKSLFQGPKWFPKCLNRAFRGVFVLKSGPRILIQAPEVPFSEPPK